MKRAFDLCAATLGLILLAPLLLAVAAALWACGGGSVFYRQVRVGRHGAPFRIWKFRTMVAGAEQLGPAFTLDGDPRVTRFGARIRRLKMDEFPQLLNVLAGEMSLVGPRPEVPAYVAHYTPSQRRVLDLLPGITDPASIRFRDEGAILAAAADPERTYLDQILPEKIRMNLEYAAKASLAADLAVILRTLAVLWPRRGA